MLLYDVISAQNKHCTVSTPMQGISHCININFVLYYCELSEIYVIVPYCRTEYNYFCRIILPLVAYRVLYILLPNGVDNGTATEDDIATFGFLLGTFPTAPTVFVFASQYSLAMEVVSVSNFVGCKRQE